MTAAEKLEWTRIDVGDTEGCEKRRPDFHLGTTNRDEEPEMDPGLLNVCNSGLPTVSENDGRERRFGDCSLRGSR